MPLRQIGKCARGPVSRVLSSALLRLCGHSSSPALARGVKRPTRATSGNTLICRPYSVLHPVGFTMPPLLPKTRCALAAPFRPYPSEGGRIAFCGTVPDSRGSRRELPGTVVPWSPDFPRRGQVPAAAARPSGGVRYSGTAVHLRVGAVNAHFSISPELIVGNPTVLTKANYEPFGVDTDQASLRAEPIDQVPVVKVVAIAVRSQKPNDLLVS